MIKSSRGSRWTAAFFGMIGFSTLAGAESVVIWDQTPAATGGTATLGLAQNRAAEQNFGDPVSFDSDTLLTGVDVITADVTTTNPTVHIGYGFVGTPVIIRVHTGANDGAVQDLASVISIRDMQGAPTTAGPAGTASYWVRAHAELATPILLHAGVTYWIGMSDNTPGTDSLGQGFMTIGPKAPAGAQTTQYYGPSQITIVGLTSPPQISMIRLWGQPSPDPVAMLAKLASDVRGVGPGKSLESKMNQAMAYYAVPDTQSTCAMLDAFRSEVAAQSGKKISAQVATARIADAQAIQAAIGCH